MRGAKILVTGPAGQIAFPLAQALARDNEVWGVARFRDAKTRARCEAAGIRTHSIDLGDGDFAELPRDFDYLLHLAIFQGPGLDYDRALRVNAEGTGLLMSHCREARACLVVSSCAVYALHGDPAHEFGEGDPLGDSRQPYSPTYAVSKIAQEATARFAARELGLPTTIARMNVSYGANGGLPAYQLDAIVAGRPIQSPRGSRALFNPIHEDDIEAQVPKLLAAATVPALVVNWAGDEVVDQAEWCRHLGGLVGREVAFEATDDPIPARAVDNTLRRRLIGDCAVPWREGMARMVRERHPGVSVGS
jgi:nucleoside-diphosphate-sugar epimerase